VSLAVADVTPAPQTRLLVLQGTPFCNIDCSYCYLPGRNSKARMAIDTVRAAARRLREDGLAGSELTVCWHAGEPLVLPIAFYEDAIGAVAEALGTATLVTHAVQTNATLIDDAWCRFLRRHGVSVGVSVDGPASLHDRHRRGRDGRPTHAAVERGMRLLRAHGVPLHAIAVVTRATLAAPDAFFDWFVDAGVHEVGCNFDETEGRHRRSSLGGHEEEHAAFLRRLLERSLASGGRLVVRELAAAWSRVSAALPSWHHAGRDWPDNAQVMPLALITVAANGDFGTFSPEFIGQQHPRFGSFAIGNVHHQGYREALRGEAFARLWAGVYAGMQACARGCAYFAHCGGGSPVNKLYETGRLDSAETLYCRSMLQRPFDAVLAGVERELAAEALR